MTETINEREKVILIGISSQRMEKETIDSLDELEELAQTANVITVGKIIQKREAQHPATYIGKGKIDEVKEAIASLNATGIICDDELSPAQIKNLEKELNTKIMDRTMVILDIFASHAHSRRVLFK